jgi:hypothetical protein
MMILLILSIPVTKVFLQARSKKLIYVHIKLIKIVFSELCTFKSNRNGS